MINKEIITLEDLENALREEGIDGVRRRNVFEKVDICFNYEFEKIPGAITIVFNLWYQDIKIRFPFYKNGLQDIEKDSGRLLKVFGEKNDVQASIVYATLPFPFNWGDKKYTREMNKVLGKIYEKEGWVINGYIVRDNYIQEIAPKGNHIVKMWNIYREPLPTASDLIKSCKEIFSIYFNLEKIKDKLPEKIEELLIKS